MTASPRGPIVDEGVAPIRDRIAEPGALQEQLRLADHKIENLSALVEISKIINSTLDLDTLLTMIMEIIQQVLNAESGSLMLIDERGEELWYRVALGAKGKELQNGFRLKMGQGIAGWVAQHGEPLLVPDVRADDRFYSVPDEVLGHRTRSMLCVPLQAQGRTFGVLQAINSKSPGGFVRDDLDLFIAFSSQAAVALENARMHARLIEKNRVEQELMIARQIQQNFLPASFPKVAGVKLHARTLPAWETGGDFYDCLDLGGGRVGAVIGDVSGKGVPAALYMVKALSEFHFHASAAAGIDRALGALNDALFERSTSGMFVTLLYVVADTGARALSWGSAGHPPGIVKRAGTGALEVLEGGDGMPLGVVSGARYAARTVPFERGDLLFLYTDGIIEARNRQGREFGMGRLKALVARSRGGAEAAVRQALRSVERFAKGAPQHDDLTALAVRMG
ncbi:MAG: SpoIIE family protein phosphatase [bacterium]|nr:SpoIIE family protein phosphatase [bacterium]